MRLRSSVAICLLSGSLLFPVSAAHGSDTLRIKSAFSQLVSIPALAEPSVIVLDEQSGEVVYE
jgi:hypothetical protein